MNGKCGEDITSQNKGHARKGDKKLATCARTKFGRKKRGGGAIVKKMAGERRTFVRNGTDRFLQEKGVAEPTAPLPPPWQKCWNKTTEPKFAAGNEPGRRKDPPGREGGRENQERTDLRERKGVIPGKREQKKG